MAFDCGTGGEAVSRIAGFWLVVLALFANAVLAVSSSPPLRGEGNHDQGREVAGVRALVP